MGLADWINRYIVEIKPDAAPGTPEKTVELVATGKTARDLLDELQPPAGATVPEPAAGGAAVVAEPPAPDEPPRDPYDDGGYPPATPEQVYTAAKLGRPAHGFTLEKIQAMLDDPRLAALDAGSRARAVAVLLEGAGVKVAAVVQDAAARDQALDRFETFLLEKLALVEEEVAERTRSLDAEVERFLARMRAEKAHNEELVHERRVQLARFRRVKRHEEERLFAVVGPFTADNPVSVSRPGEEPRVPVPSRPAGEAAAPPVEEPAAATAEPAAAEPAAAEPDVVASSDTGRFSRADILGDDATGP